MIQETILVLGVIFIIVWLFYNDSVPEFRINQLEWPNRLTVQNLLSEKLPIILRDAPHLTIWTHEDVLNRPVYSTVPVFEDSKISLWLESVLDKQYVDCPWTLEHARLLGKHSAIDTWSARWLNELMYPSYMSFIGKPKASCWVGARTIWRSIAPWTAIMPTEGEIVVSIMPVRGFEHALPTNPENHWLPRITKYDTPFVGDLKLMDIRLRPGHILLMPAHWYISWEESELDKEGLEGYGLQGPPMVCMIEFHNIFTILEEWKVLKSTNNDYRGRESVEKYGQNRKTRTGPVVSFEEEPTINGYDATTADIRQYITTSLPDRNEQPTQPEQRGESGQPDTQGVPRGLEPAYREFNDSDEES